CKEGAPGDRFGQDGVQSGIDEGRQTRPHGGPRLDKTDSAAAVLVADHLAHQHRAGGPLAAKAEAVQTAQYEELRVVLGKGAQEGEDRIPQDGDLQYADTAVAVGQRAGKPAAE